MVGQRLDRHLGHTELVQQEVAAPQVARNERRATISMIVLRY